MKGSGWSMPLRVIYAQAFISKEGTRRLDRTVNVRKGLKLFKAQRHNSRQQFSVIYLA